MKHSCVSWIIRKESVPGMGGLALQLWLSSQLRMQSVLIMLLVSGHANLSQSPKTSLTLWLTLQRHSLQRDGNFSRQLLQSKTTLEEASSFSSMSSAALHQHFTSQMMFGDVFLNSTACSEMKNPAHLSQFTNKSKFHVASELGDSSFSW